MESEHDLEGKRIRTWGNMYVMKKQYSLYGKVITYTSLVTL
jgi:hypothetical protein